MKPGDAVIVESATPNKRWPGQPPDTRPGVLIAADQWEGDEQWTYVHLDDGTKIAVEPWRVRPDDGHWHHRCDILACNCGRCHDCRQPVKEEA